MAEASAANLRNEDFRKLLATERGPHPATADTPARESGPSFSHRAKPKDDQKKKGGHGHKHKKERQSKGAESEDDESLTDILKNYRDRAAERRKHGDDEGDDDRLTAAYRAVPGDPRMAADAIEKRRKAIQESKFLGGDMEHTHLVKGLDYSLLNKVRSEIAKTQVEIADDDLDKAYMSKDQAVEILKESDNKMVRSINKALFKDQLPLRNDLFQKGRMAYVVEMEEEDAEIPTTLLRSLLDCPVQESTATVAANNALIQKLTQVLAYLRTDTKKKKKVGEMAEEERVKHKNDSIYDNEGDYVPKREREKDEKRGKDDRKEREKDRDYFDRDRRDRDRSKSRERDRGDRRDKDRRGDRRDRDRDRKDKDRERRDDKEKERERDRLREKEDQKTREREEQEEEKKREKKKLDDKMEKRKKDLAEGYDECYPGGYAELGGAWDSDEEDFSKMDQGNKKGPIKRWDFEHEEDYEKYQGQREALPKAAYQFGVKTSDGRKTRKTTNQPQTQDKKLDRELNEINKMMEKRKTDGGGGDSHSKRPKY